VDDEAATEPIQQSAPFDRLGLSAAMLTTVGEMGFSLATPILEASDENSHTAVVWNIAAGHGLPVLALTDRGKVLVPAQEAGQPALAFLRDSQTPPVGWMYAFTDRVGDVTGSGNLANSPGAKRYLARVTQVVDRYNLDGSLATPSPITLMAYFQSPVTATDRHGNQVVIQGIAQPTYAVANPLAVRGG